ncbi:MAG TPA: hypothetical protein VMU54_02295 [Planctomycetota bacterium]|nr:hypothetical protein [Planctomycetota bacterium]
MMMLERGGCLRGRGLVPAAALLFAWLGAARADAQVDSNLLRREWQPEDHWSDSSDKPFFLFKEDVRHSEETVEMFHWESSGRVKTDRTDRDPQFWFGYKVLTVGIAGLETVPHGLYDVGLAVAGKLGSIGPEWTLEACGGVGTANDGSFGNLRAIYPAATVLAVQELAPRQFLELGITYDGNSALAPRLPMPVVEFEAHPDPSLRLRAGFPHLEAEYLPFADLSLRLIGDYPADARLEAEFALGSGLAAFAEAARRLEPFHLREDGRERIFYRLYTGELGLRFRGAGLDVSLSGGWAFGQEFFTGYDLRDRSPVAVPEGGPFAALTVQGTF